MYKMKLLVSGCSVTHGAEIYKGFMHPENVKKSYSQHLANKLGLELLNVAMSAGSNEYIFHSIVDQIQKYNDIDSVLVMWTSTDRIYWKCNNRHYFILGHMATSKVDCFNYIKHEKNVNGAWFTGDDDDIVNKLAEVHKFFVMDYFDKKEALAKLQNYSMLLDVLCNQKNIKLIQLTWKDIRDVWGSNPQKHPTVEEHEKIADLIYTRYYDNKQ